MPLQNILTSEANARIARSGRKDLAFAPVGQIVVFMNDVRPVRDVMFQLVEEYIDTVEHLGEGLQVEDRSRRPGPDHSRVRGR